MAAVVCRVGTLTGQEGAGVEVLSELTLLQNLPLPTRIWLTAAVVCQVETLAGQVVAVDVDAGATLGAIREGIARQTGILVKQQRLIVLGEPDPCPTQW